MANPTVFQSVLSLSAPRDLFPALACNSANGNTALSPFPTFPPPSSTLNPGSTGRLIDPDYRNPVAEEFNVGYTRALYSNSVVEAEYTHVLGLHENITINIDQKIPDTARPIGSQCCYRPLDPAFAASARSRRNGPRP